MQPYASLHRQTVAQVALHGDAISADVCIPEMLLSNTSRSDSCCHALGLPHSAGRVPENSLSPRYNVLKKAESCCCCPKRLAVCPSGDRTRSQGWIGQGRPHDCSTQRARSLHNGQLMSIFVHTCIWVQLTRCLATCTMILHATWQACRVHCMIACISYISYHSVATSQNMHHA